MRKRLQLRASWPLLAALVLCVCGLNYGLPKAFAGAIMQMPLLPILVIEVGVTLSAALLFYDEATPVQAIKIALVILVLTALFAGLSYVANPLLLSDIRQRPVSQAPVISINWVFLLTVNASAISVAKALIVLASAQPGGRKKNSSFESDI